MHFPMSFAIMHFLWFYSMFEFSVRLLHKNPCTVWLSLISRQSTFLLRARVCVASSHDFVERRYSLCSCAVCDGVSVCLLCFLAPIYM